MTASPEFSLDNAANRAARKYSRSEQWRRVAWMFGHWLLVLSPRPMHGWRRLVLRAFGARVGAEVHVHPAARIEMPWNVELGDWSSIGDGAHFYSLGKIRVGAYATVSYRAHLCAGTHDFRDPKLPLLKPPIEVRRGAWIGTEAFVGPGVTVGEGALVGARAVVVRNVPDAAVVVGNPARIVGTRTLRSPA